MRKLGWYPKCLPAKAPMQPEEAKAKRQPSRPKLALRPRADHKLADLLRLADDLHWYALHVSAQKEFVAQVILERYGLATFVPTRHEWRKRSKYGKEKELKHYALAPRYVFAGFPMGRPLWFDLFKLPLIQSAVGIAGEPMRIAGPAMQALLRETGAGISAPDAHRFMKTYHEFGEGDLVKVVDGPFSGMTVPVKEIAGDRASLLFELFGGAVETIDLPLEVLEAAE